VNTLRTLENILITLFFVGSIGVAHADDDEYRNNGPDDDYTKTTIIEGKVATGPNRYLDKPLRDYGVILGIPAGTLGFSELAEHNPLGSNPIPLTMQTPDSAILASDVDPNFLAFLGLTIDDIDPDLINVPLQEVMTLVSKDGVTRGTLPSIFDSVPLSQSIAAPNDPITLGDWKKAKGKAILKCQGTNRGSVKMTFDGLVPNRIYTAWGGIISAERGLIEEPLGGAPSAFVSDKKGKAKFERELNFCPLDFSEEANAYLAWIMVVIHTDHMVYGGVFSPEEIGLVGGTTANVQMEFHILGEEVTLN